MSSASNSAKKILVIDDDQTFRDLIKEGADKEKYQVAVAADGLEGLASVSKNVPDLILLDVSMPRMSGVEFLEKMRQSGNAIPVIITSNDSSLETISRGTELGIRGYVVKSNESLKTIMEIVERVLGGHTGL